MIAINFVIFMVSEIIYKVNVLDSNSIALGKIISNKKVKEPNSIGEYQKNYGEFAPFAREQFKLRGKSWKKLPVHSENGCLFLQRAFEQCTSEVVAKWKAKEFSSKKMLNLTGGLGIDDWAWAKTGCDVMSIEIDPILNHISRLNFQKLGVKVDRIDGDTHSLISQINTTNFDLIYIDPDRRIENNFAGYNPKNFSPNISEILEILKNKFNRILIKLSPYTDIEWLKNEFPDCTKICVVQYGDDVKEILILFENNKSYSQSLDGYFIEDNHKFSKWNADKVKSYQFENIGMSQIWVPNGMANCLKINELFKEFSNFKTVSNYTGLFITENNIPESLGKTYKIFKEFKESSLKQLKMLLKKHNISSGGLRARNVKGLSSSEIQKKLNISEGNKYQLFLVCTETGKFNLWVTEK